MGTELKGEQGPSRAPRKRPLARRSCLKCREKKARCELPDVYVDSTKSPLPAEKQCHRCNVLGIDCIVWDGDRKRKPRLDHRDVSTPGSSVERDDAAPNHGVDGRSRPPSPPNAIPRSARRRDSKASAALASSQTASLRGSAFRSSQNADGEQLAASDLSHAQRLLINRQNAWRTMSSTLHTLIERLQRERKYDSYLKLRIDAPPSTPDFIAFLQPDRILQLDLQLQDYLVGHPYLPTLSDLHRQQTQKASRPRALLLATMTLLGLKGIDDELTSADTRTLSNYIDRLGTQMLLSSPRDIHLVMAFELLLAHEPGLVGTAASQFEPEGRGFGLASENLLTCSMRIARELRLDDAVRDSQCAATRLMHLSLWCCLRVWESMYAFLGENFTFIDDLDAQSSAAVREILRNVDGEGKSLPPPPRLPDANGPTAGSYHEMRDFCIDMEKRHGRDGILRSAGRTILCQRIETSCCLFSSLRMLRETLEDQSTTKEEKQQKVSDIHTQATGGMLMVRDLTDEQLGFYAGQRLVRVWEQFVHIECVFFCALFGSYCSSALVTGSVDGAIDSGELIQLVRFRLDPHERIAEIGRFSLDMSRVLLSYVAQLDRQPALRKQSAPGQGSSRYLYRLPALLVCAMAVQSARRCLESIAFVLVAWARTSSDASTMVTIMEAAIPRIRQLAPGSISEEASGIAQVSADYVDEMVETARLWQVYYRVYRPVSDIRLSPSGSIIQPDPPNPVGAEPPTDGLASTETTELPASGSRSAMDFLASAAEAVQESGSTFRTASSNPGAQPAPKSTSHSNVAASAGSSTSAIFPTASEASLWSGQSLEESGNPPSTAMPPASGYLSLMDAGIYDACVPFDLEAFLKDVDQLF